MSNPLVSVIIPAFNAEHFISEALDSVFAQTYRLIEVIAVDDGSTDKTADIVRKYVRDVQDARNVRTSEAIELIYIYQENAGPSKARNTGIKAAKGDYIAFLDADDRWTPEKLEKQMKFMTANPEISFVFGDMMVFDAHESVIDSVFKKYGYPPCNEKGKIINAFENLLERNFIPTGTDLIKKACFEKTGYFDESVKHGEDYGLWLRITLMYEIGYIPEILMQRRLHNKNLSKEQEKFYKSKISLLESIKKEYALIIKQKNVDINSFILKSIKKMSYFYYLNKRYLNALKAMGSYILYYCKNNLARI